jgi:acyl-homoserine lactone acylase PvdQ
MNQYNEQNVMIADVHGTIGYVRNGATPDRPDGYDWSAPVPGNTSKTAWKGLHPIDDLVHIFDPPQGYMQNCNISPQNMMVGSPLTPDKYKKHIYNVSWDTNNPRSIRTVEILDADKSVTREDAIACAMDVHDIQAPRWQHELKSAVAAVGKNHSEDGEFSRAVEAILAWDGEFTPDATATTLYKFWRLKCGNEIELAPLAEGKELGSADRGKMLDLLAGTIKEMHDRYGRWDVAWGEVHRVGRGGKLFPVGGCDFRSGNREANHSETLFDVGSKEDADKPGYYIANNGSMATILMFFHKDGIRSYSCIPWGQSADPESPHYMDQGEKLYSQRQMKDTWWAEADAKAHAKSEKVLTVK